MLVQSQSDISDAIEHTRLLEKISCTTKDVYLEFQFKESTIVALTDLVDRFINKILSDKEEGVGIKKFERLLLAFSMLEYHFEFQNKFEQYPIDISSKLIRWHQTKDIEISKAREEEEQRLFKKGFKDTFKIGITPPIGDQWGFRAQITKNIHDIFAVEEELQ